MKCPFCQEEVENFIEKIKGNATECRCPRCNSVTAAYQKGMEDRLKNLVSLERFERSTK
jgi:uncharacterized Zn finger protein